MILLAIALATAKFVARVVFPAPFLRGYSNDFHEALKRYCILTHKCTNIKIHLYYNVNIPQRMYVN